MRSVAQLGPGAVWYRVNHFGREHLTDWAVLHQAVVRDFAESGIELASIKDQQLVLDFSIEGHDAADVDLVVQYFEQMMPINQIGVLFNAAVNVEELRYRAASWTTHLVDHMAWFSTYQAQHPRTLTHKFLCLNRRPSQIRAEFLSALLDQVSDTEVMCSFGANGDVVGCYQHLFPRHQLPLLIDGTCTDIVSQHQLPQIFQQCMFNIICESSDPGSNQTWNSCFVSEKTFKCFALQQIPIWMAVPGLVREVRRLGFDLFDDIVDHSYDRIQDHHQRRSAVLAEIVRLDQQYPRDQLPYLQQHLTTRLENNYNRLKMFVADHSQIYQNYLLDLSR